MIFQKKRGQSLIEILVGLGVGAIIIIGVSTLMVSNLKSSLSVKVNQAASSLAQELINSVKSIAESDWRLVYSNLSKGSAYNYYVATSTKSIVPGTETITAENRNFTRSFYVDNVNRDLCSIGDITASSSIACPLGPGTSGITNDPSTQKITAVVKDSGGNNILSAFEYVVRKRNISFIQTDWSAGSGQEGPITSPNSAFSASTNITYTSSTGSIYTTAASGTLISSTIDTGMASGTAPNFIIWKGQLNGGTVKFQIASSNNSSGPWTYLGPAGTSDESTDWYSAASDVSMPISLALHNNKRYFRYKVFLYLGTHSPGINDIIINWSP
ncbi:MAG: prepilin-type N-terminal cleavage/methylation domain-containing protein [Patescibacteria group bacterium]